MKKPAVKKVIFAALSILAFIIILFLLRQPSPSFSTPEEFGADGFDLGLDTEAIQKALDSGAETVKLKEGATYYIDQTLTANQSIKLVSGSKKATIIQQSEDERVFHFRNRPRAAFPLEGDVEKGVKAIKASAANEAQHGDIIELKSDMLWHWDNRNSLTKGELHTVEKVSGDTIYLSSKTDDSYAVSEGEKVIVNLYSPKTIHVENVRFSYTEPVKNTAIIVDPAVDSTFKNINVSKAQETGLKLIKNINATLEKSFFSLHTDESVPTGYGFQDFGGRGTTVRNSTFEKVRRGVDFSGDIPSRFGRAENNTAYGPDKGTLAAGNSGFGTHSTAEYITFENNTVENFDYHFVSRGNHISFLNNIGTGNARAFFHITYGGEVRLKGNHYADKDGNELDYFILKGTEFDGHITEDENTGPSRIFKQ
ncbi:right-handed parallel beta-helix repeat-containing protein [Bacillus infantis]|uniref:right-handed parallel beta-helix repeat-containing protein n=1 Tax=Bacillus infantis TaxID=324767 RepID=UPI001CD58C07|nr:right-handed parallel beta-helix repeat-containing protein [Bacillus infantis]MCA1033594.1 right-handed parallel beta-helix repeat-containing protein [Bacillus infantis]